MAVALVEVMSRFPSWVPGSSMVVNALVSMLSFSTASVLGYDASMMNAFNILPSYTEYFSLTAATIGLNSGIVWIGACVGSLAPIKLPDHIGRKPALFYSAMVSMIGSALQTGSQDIAMFLVARFILGVGVGGTYVAEPILITETLPTKYRALGLGAFTDVYYVGGLMSSGITYGTAKISSTWAWRVPSLLQLVFTIVSVATLPWIPESPRYLAHRARLDEALKAIAQACSDGDLSDTESQAQLLQMTQSLKFELNIEEPSVWEIARNPALRKPIIIVFTVAVVTMMAGSNIFSYYLGTSLTNAGITDPTTQLEISIILNAFCLVVSVVGTFLADSLGRKQLALISTAGCTVFLFIIGALARYYGTSTNETAIYASIAMMFLAQGFYSFGWTPLATMYPPEVLNYQIRSVGMSWFVTWQNLVLLVPIFAYPVAVESIGWIIYMINGAFDFLALFAIAFYWVETRNLSLEAAKLFDPRVEAEIIDIEATVQKIEPGSVNIIDETVRETKAAAGDAYGSP
ncbi:Sugar (and other) transporter [Geosmithia morbida]|uniref:Sugar (And other) transporter n=1 Tax=Geosmithia morbida TaxID=1094350 RepID=A0A9P4Z3Q7_9HYPO|nr:Sugar (and other) transporter [Geosmithia morbida]KAF4126971.1 Sugar (and other) transporter [Geosmithia morbida]